MSSGQVRFGSKMFLIEKRCFDMFISVLTILLLTPLFIVLVFMVWIDSGLPVLYRGVRTGKNGIPFKIFKYRSMVRDADQIGGHTTGKNDMRVTRVGRWLRRSKLDELPQLFNVLVGDMSFVGPRPELPKYTFNYVGDEMLILGVRPGITDYASLAFVQLADVVGSYDPEGVYERIVLPKKNALRIKYVRDMSWSTDLSILFQTMRKVLK